jgi:hypothetical protein
MKQSVLCSIALLSLLSACAGRQLQANTISSGESAAYAARYPEQLESTRARLAEEKSQAQTLSGGLAGRAKELKAPLDSVLVLRIVDAADDAGHSEAMRAAHAEARAVRTFWEEERGTIGARVNNAVQQKAEEAKCESTELTSSVPYALREGVDKQLERRLRARNEAQLVIERNKVALGQPNSAALQKLTDDIAMNSYLVNIALVEDGNELSRMLSERRQVQRTLEDAIAEEQAYGKSAQSAQERKHSNERLAEYTKSRDALANATTNAEGEIKTADEQVRAARSEYETALDALRDEIRKLDAKR